MGLAYYDTQTGEALWTGTTVTPAGGDLAYFGYVEGSGIVPAPVTYIAGHDQFNGNSSVVEAVYRPTWTHSELIQQLRNDLLLSGQGSGEKSLLFVGNYDYYVANRLSRGIGAPTRTTPQTAPTSTPQRRRPARRRRAKNSRSCPPGHYYSWKKRTCVKSKY